MGISQFPPASGGGLSNDFILNKNNSTNNTFALPREFEAGGYGIVTGSNDSSYDIYLINAAGSSVGYTSGSAIVASQAFDTVVILGIGTAETVQFQYRGPSTNATSQGLEPGAGAYLLSLTPSDLPNIDDTTVVTGGNFSTAVQVTFESGTAVLSAKNVVVGSSTALVVTRPDNLVNDLSPYSLRAVNPGVTQPTGSTANILAGTITAGQDPSFVTGSPLLGAVAGSAFSTAILTSDTDGTVVNWAITAGTIPPGLTLATATGIISGTPTTNGDYFFTVRITDDGQNTNTREYNLPVGPVISGANSTVVGGTTYVWFTASGDLTYKNVSSLSVPYIAIAGGGGGGGRQFGDAGGGGGAGGLLFGTATITGTGTAAVTIGAGGAGGGGGAGAADTAVPGRDGSNTVWTGFATAFGGGGGGAGLNNTGTDGRPGGSGGGGGYLNKLGGAGTASQGTAGRNYSDHGGGGGGAGTTFRTGGVGNSAGWNGRDFGAWASAIGIIYDGGFFAGGGGGGLRNVTGTAVGGLGGGGQGAHFDNNPAKSAGSANSGGGGGAGQNASTGMAGGSGLLVVRFS